MHTSYFFIIVAITAINIRFLSLECSKQIFKWKNEGSNTLCILCKVFYILFHFILYFILCKYFINLYERKKKHILQTQPAKFVN